MSDLENAIASPSGRPPIPSSPPAAGRTIDAIDLEGCRVDVGDPRIVTKPKTPPEGGAAGNCQLNGSTPPPPQHG